jgi:phosphatidate cytidylyltransferase
MKQRIVTGLIAGAVFIGLLLAGGAWYSAFIFVMAAVGYNEYIRMNQFQKNTVTSAIGLIGMLLLTVPWESGRFVWHFETEQVLWIPVFALLSVTVFTKNRIKIDQVSLIALGIVYMGFGFHYMLVTRLLEHGLFWSFLIFVCIWVTDSGAYFVGSKLGKHPLWPAISPKKSVEGAIGGIVASVVAAAVFSLASPGLLPIGQALLLGIVIAVVGQLGDLIQSAYKRVKGIKDTGAILPGHGGILDRVDSWLIVFPFLHLLSIVPVS